MKALRKSLFVFVCLMCAVLLTGCSTMLFSKKADTLGATAPDGTGIQRYASWETVTMNGDVYPVTTLRDLQNRMNVQATLWLDDEDGTRDVFDLTADQYKLTLRIEYTNGETRTISDLGEQIGKDENANKYTLIISTPDSYTGRQLAPAEQEIEISAYPSVSDPLTFAVKADETIYDTTPINTGAANDFLHKITVSSGDVVLMPELLHVTVDDTDIPEGKTFKAPTTRVTVSYVNPTDGTTVSSASTPVTVSSAQVTSVAVGVNTEKAYLSGGVWYRNTGAFGTLAESEDSHEYDGYTLERVSQKQVIRFDDGTSYLDDKAYYAFTDSSTPTAITLEMLAVTLYDTAGNAHVITANHPNVTVSIDNLGQTSRTVTVSYSGDDGSPAPAQCTLSVPQRVRDGLFLVWNSEQSNVTYESVDKPEKLREDKGFYAYGVYNSGMLGEIGAADYELVGRDLAPTSEVDGEGYYNKVVTGNLRGNPNAAADVTIRVRYSAIKAITFGGSIPNIQVAKQPLNPYYGTGGISLTWEYDSVSAQTPYYLAQGETDGDGWISAGLGKYKVYYFDSPYESRVAPTGSLTADGSHYNDSNTQYVNSDGNSLMSRSVTWVRIVYKIEANGAIQPEEVSGYGDFPTTVYTTIQIDASLVGIVDNGLTWDKVADGVYGAQQSISGTERFGSFDGYLKQGEEKAVIKAEYQYAPIGNSSYTALSALGDSSYGMAGEEYLRVDTDFLFAAKAGQYRVRLSMADTEGSDYRWPSDISQAYGATVERNGNDIVAFVYNFTVHPMQGEATFELLKPADGTATTADDAQDEKFSFEYQVLKLGTGADDVRMSFTYTPDKNYKDLGRYAYNPAIGAIGDTTADGYELLAWPSDARFLVYFSGTTFGGQSVWMTYDSAAPNANQLPTAPGNYAAYVVVEAFGNYARAQSSTFEFAILRKQIVIDWTNGYSIISVEGEEYTSTLTYNENGQHQAIKYMPVDYLSIVNQGKTGNNNVTDWGFSDDSGALDKISLSYSNAGRYTLTVTLNDEASYDYELVAADGAAGIEIPVSDDGVKSTNTAVIQFVINPFENAIGIHATGWQYHSYVSNADNAWNNNEISFTKEPTYTAVQDSRKVFYTGYLTATEYSAYTTWKASNPAAHGLGDWIAAGNTPSLAATDPNDFAKGTYYAYAYNAYRQNTDEDDFHNYTYVEAFVEIAVTKLILERPTVPAGTRIYSGDDIDVVLDNFNRYRNKTTGTYVTEEGALELACDVTDGVTLETKEITTEDSATKEVATGKITVVHAKEYTLTVTLSDTNLYGWSTKTDGSVDADGTSVDVITLTFVVFRKSIAKPNDAADDLMYDKNTVYDAMDSSHGKYTEYADYGTLAEGKAYRVTDDTESNLTGQDAGDYDLTFRLNSDDYYWADSTVESVSDPSAVSANTDMEREITWTILKRRIEAFTDADIQNKQEFDRIYDGSEHTFGLNLLAAYVNHAGQEVELRLLDGNLVTASVAGVTANGDMFVRVNDGTIPNNPNEYLVYAKHAGTYTITLTFDTPAAKNYTWSVANGDNSTVTQDGSITLSFTIDQREITVDWGEVRFTYNGENQKPAPTISNGVAADGDSNRDGIAFGVNVFAKPDGSEDYTEEVTAHAAAGTYLAKIDLTSLDGTADSGVAIGFNTAHNYKWPQEGADAYAALEQLYSIVAATVNTPILNAVGSVTVNGTAATAPYIAEGAEKAFYTFSDYLAYKNDGGVEDQKLDEWLGLLTVTIDGITQSSTTDTLRNVKWNADGTTVNAYRVVVTLSDPDDYTWSESTDADPVTEYVFTFKITPLTIEKPGDADSFVYETEYNGKAQDFLSAANTALANLATINDYIDREILGVTTDNADNSTAFADVKRKGAADAYAVDSYGITFSIENANYVWVYNDTDDTCDNEEKSYGFTIYPVELAVNWNGTDERSYSGEAQLPEAAIANTFDGMVTTDSVAIDVTLASGWIEKDTGTVHTVGTLTDGKAVNAGYYTATVSLDYSRNDKSGNYKITKSADGDVRHDEYLFLIRKAAVAAPTTGKAETAVYDGKEKTFNISGYDADLMQYDADASTAVNYAGADIDPASITFDETQAADGILTLKALHAGFYAFSVSLKSTVTGNYYWQEAGEAMADPEAENAAYDLGSSLTIERAAIRMPAITRGIEFAMEGGNYVPKYPEFKLETGNVSVENGGTVALPASDGETAWSVDCVVTYGENDGTVNSGDGYTLTVTPKEASTQYDYYFVSSADADEQLEKNQLGVHADVIQTPDYAPGHVATVTEVSITLYYKITKRTFQLALEVKYSGVTDWIYGEDGSHIEFGLQTGSAVASGFTGWITVAYYRDNTFVGGYTKSGNAWGFANDDNKLIVKTGNTEKAITADDTFTSFAPLYLPYAAGEYEARITFHCDASDATYQTEQTYYVPFTIQKKLLTVDWANKEFAYDGATHMATATVNNTETQIGNVITGDNLTLRVKAYDGGAFIDDPKNVKWNGTAEEAYTVAVSEILGAGAANYTLFDGEGETVADIADGLKNTLAIHRRAVTVTAPQDGMDYGTRDKVGNGKAGAGNLGGTLGIEIAQADTDGALDYSALTDAFRAVLTEQGYEIRAVKSATGSTVEYVVYNTDVGVYDTAVFVKDDNGDFVLEGDVLSDYAVTYVRDTFTISQKAIEVQWNESTFVYNGKDQYTDYETAYGSPFVWFVDIDGNAVALGNIAISGNDGGSAFKNADTYTFTVQSMTSANGTAFDANYKLPGDGADHAETLTHEYTIAKRAVSVVAQNVTTTYGTDGFAASAAQQQWAYAAGTAESAMFVDASGKAIAAGGNLSANGFTFAVKTTATADTTPAESANTYTYIVYTMEEAVEVELVDGVVFANYTVTVRRGTHTVEKKTLNADDIAWKNTEFTYNGFDQTKEKQTTSADQGTNMIAQSAYFIDAVSGEERFLYVYAYSGESTRVPFINYTVSGYHFRIHSLTEEDAACYVFGDIAANRTHTATMQKRAVSIEILDATKDHIYGNDVDQSTLAWRYSGDSENNESLQFVSLSLENGIYTIDNADVFTTLSFTLKIVGKEKTLDNTLTVGTYDLTYSVTRTGYENADAANYALTVTKAGTVTVVPRPVTLTVVDLTSEYGKRLAGFGHTVSAYGTHAEAIVNDDAAVVKTNTVTNNGMTYDNGVYKLEVVFGTDGKLPAANAYDISLTLINENYTIYWATDAAVTTQNPTAVAATYTVTASQVLKNTLSTDVKPDDYTYDGAQHGGDLEVSYIGETGDVSGADATAIGLSFGSADAVSNNLKWYFRYDEAGNWASAWTDITAEAIVANDSAWKTTAPWTDASVAPSFKDVGVYTVYFAVLADNHAPAIGANYKLTVTVTKATVYVSFALEMYYGETLPAATYWSQPEFIGLVSGETITFTGSSSALSGTVSSATVADLSGSVSFSVAYDAGDKAGDYPLTLTLTGISAKNYVFEQASGDKDGVKYNNMVIKQLPITLTINDQTAVYYTPTEGLPDLTHGAYDVTGAAVADYAYVIYVGSYDGTTHEKVEAVRKDGDITTMFAGDTITLASKAVVNGTTNNVGDYAIYLADILRADSSVTANYTITYYATAWAGSMQDTTAASTQMATYTVTPASMTSTTLYGYTADYNEQENWAIVTTEGGANQVNGDMTEADDVMITVDGKESERVWSYIGLTVRPAAVDSEAVFAALGTPVSDMPAYIDAGTYYVAYRVTAPNHETEYGYVTVTIEQATNTWETDYAISGTTWVYGNDPATETMPVAKFNNRNHNNNTSGTGILQPVVQIKQGGNVIATYAYAAYNATEHRYDVTSWLATVATAEHSAYTAGYKLGAQLPVGTYTVTVSMAGNANFTAISETEVATFKVTARPLVFKPTSDKTYVYGTAAADMQADLLGTDYAYTVEGFAAWHTVGTDYKQSLQKAGFSGDPSFQVYADGSAPTTTQYAPGYTHGSVGRYVLDIGAGEMTLSANYASDFDTNGTVTITQRKISVTIGSHNDVAYDLNRSVNKGAKPDEAPVFDFTVTSETKEYNGTYTVEGFSLSEHELLRRLLTSEGVAGWTTYTVQDGRVMDRTADVKEGGYPIRFLTSGDDYGDLTVYADFDKNYEIDVTEGTLTIVRAMLGIRIEITYNGETKTYDAAAAYSSIVYNGGTVEIQAVNAAEGDANRVKIETTYTDADKVSSTQAPKDAGTYTFSFEAENNPNYWVNTTGFDNFGFTIKPRAVRLAYTVMHKDAAFTDAPVYDGTAYTVTASFETSDGTDLDDEKVVEADEEAFRAAIAISYESTEYGTAIPVNAARYNVASALTAGMIANNYTIANTDYGALTITKALYNAITAADFAAGEARVYNGAAQAFRVNNYLTDSENIAFVGDAAIMSATVSYRKDGTADFAEAIGKWLLGADDKYYLETRDVGEYRVVFCMQDSKNYGWTNVGSFTYDATQETLTFTVTITKATLQVIANNISIAYGENVKDFETQITGELIFSGLVGADAASSKTEISDGIVKTDTAMVTPFTYPSTQSGQNPWSTTAVKGSTFNIVITSGYLTSDNYEIVAKRNGDAVQYGQLTVGARAVTVKVGDLHSVYKSQEYNKVTAGTIDVTANAYSDLVQLAAGSEMANGTDIYALGISFTMAGINAGEYPIVFAWSNTNYNVTFSGSWTGDDANAGKAGTYTIEKASLTVTIANTNTQYAATGTTSVAYGETPTYRVTFGGFVGGAEESYFYDGKEYAVNTAPDAENAIPQEAIVSAILNGTTAYAAWTSRAGETYALTLAGIGDGETGANGFTNYKIGNNDLTQLGSMRVAKRNITAQVTNGGNAFDYAKFREAGYSYDFASFTQDATVEIEYNAQNAPEATVTLAYDGTLENGTTIIAQQHVNHAGRYSVIVTLSANSDYAFAGQTNCTLDYVITPALLPVFCGAVLDVEANGYTTISGYDANLMHFDAFTHNSVSVPQSGDGFANADGSVWSRYEDGELKTSIGVLGSYGIHIELKSGTGTYYRNDFLLVASQGSAEGYTELTLNYTVVQGAGSLGFTVTVKVGSETKTTFEYRTTYTTDVSIDPSSGIDLSAESIGYTFAPAAPLGNVALGEITLGNTEIEKLSFSPLWPTSVGRYVVRAILPAGTGHSAARATYVFEITPKGITVTTFADGQNAAYDHGNTQSATVGDYDDDTMRLAVSGKTFGENEKDLSAMIALPSGQGNATVSAANAGRYTITVTLRDTTNYRWVDADGKATAAPEYTWEIAKAANALSDFADVSVQYGESYAFAAAADYGTVTYVYQRLGTTLAELPRNAGTYRVFATVAESDNYNGIAQIADNSRMLTISPATLTVVHKAGSIYYGYALNDRTGWIDADQFDYDVSGYAYDDKDLIVGNVQYISSASGEGAFTLGASVGTYNVGVSPTSLGLDPSNPLTANYTLAFAAPSLDLTVVARPITVTIRPQRATFNGSTKPTIAQVSGTDYAITSGEVYNRESLGITLDAPTMVPNATTGNYDARTYALVGSYTNANYNVTFIDGTYTIERLTLNFTGVTVEGGYTYDPTAGAMQPTNNAFVLKYTIDGTTYTWGEANAYAAWLNIRYSGSDAATPLNVAGTYRVTILSNDTVNVLVTGTTANSSVRVEKFTLSTANLNLGTALSLAYTGTALPDATANAGLLTTIVQAGDGTVAEGLYTASFTGVTYTGVGEYTNAIRLSLGSNFDNYKWNGSTGAEINLAFSIVQATIDVAFAGDTSISHQYDGTAHTSEFAVRFVDSTTGNDVVIASPRLTYLVSDAASGTYTAVSDLTQYANAGTYYFKVQIDGTDNYTGATTSGYITYTVAPRVITAITVNNLDANNAFIAGNYGSVLAPISYSVTLDETGVSGSLLTSLRNRFRPTVTYTGASNGNVRCAGGALPTADNKVLAGSYTATLTCTDNNFSYTGAPVVITYIVDRQAVYSDSITPIAAEYSNSAKLVKNSISGLAGYGVQYVEKNATESYTDAGSYDFEVTLCDADNYYWYAYTGEGHVATDTMHKDRTLRFTITAAEIKSVTLQGVTFTVGDTTSVWSSTDPTRLASWSYGDTVTPSGSVRIVYGAGNYSRTVSTGFTLSYCDTESGVFTTSLPRNVGNGYYVKVALSADRNFTNADGYALAPVLVFQIKKAANAISNFTDKEITYGDPYTFAATALGDDVKYTYTQDGQEVTPRYVGTYTVTATVAESDNFLGATAEVTLTIIKATLTVSANARTITYGDAFDGTANNGTQYFTLRSLKYTDEQVETLDGFTGAPTYTTDYTQGANAGNYTLSIASIDGMVATNYAFAIDSRTATLAVARKEITVTLNDQSSVYNGRAPIIKQTAQDGAWTVEGLVAGDTEELLLIDVTRNSTSANAGTYTLSGRLASLTQAQQATYKNNNYTATVVSAIYTIDKYEVDGQDLADAAARNGYLTLPYSGTEQGLSQETRDSIEDLWVSYSGVSGINTLFYEVTTDTGLDVGYYNAYVTLKDSFYVNYKWTGLEKVYTLRFRITRNTNNNVTLSYKNGNTLGWEYDGKDALATHKDSFRVTGAEISFGLNTAVYEFAAMDLVPEYSETAPTDAGTYLVRVRIPETLNYVGAYSDALTFTIRPRRLTAELTPQNGTVRLNSVGLLGNPDILRLVDYDVYYYGQSNDETWKYTLDDCMTEAPAKPGQYHMAVRLTEGADNGNYVLTIGGEETTYVWTDYDIAKWILRLADVVKTQLVYNGQEQRAEDTLASDENYGVLYSLSETAAQINAGTYSTRLVLKDTANYEWADSTASAIDYTWTIAKCKLNKPVKENCMVNGKDESFIYFIDLGFDGSLVQITGNTASGEGNYTAVISLLDKNNYEWADGTVDDILLDWTVKVPAPVAFAVTVALLSVLLAGSGVVCGVIVYQRKKLEKRGVRR